MAAVADASVPGFSQDLKISRQQNNASLATICFGQVLETPDSLRCQGQTVTLSFWAKAGATYSGGALTVQVIAGGGVNQSAAEPRSGNLDVGLVRHQCRQALTASMTRYQFTGVVPVDRDAARRAAVVHADRYGGRGRFDITQRRTTRNRHQRVAVRAH